MPITIGLNMEREEFDLLKGILLINGHRVAPMLTECLREKAAALKDKTSEKLDSSDADGVRLNVHTPTPRRNESDPS